MIFIRDDVRIALSHQANFDSIIKMNGVIFSKGHNRRTFSIHLGGKRYFVKIHTGVGWREIIKNLSQLKYPIVSARNEWQAIQKLHELGIPTMNIAAYGERGLNPAKRQSFVMTDALSRVESLEKFCPKYFTGILTREKILVKRAIIKKVAEIARTLHQNGLNHQDFYICHILIHVPNGHHDITHENLKLFLIDLHRVMIREKTPKRAIIKDLAGIYFSSLDLPLTRSDLFRFITTYRNSHLKEIFPKEKRFWKKVETRAQKIHQKLSKRK